MHCSEWHDTVWNLFFRSRLQRRGRNCRWKLCRRWLTLKFNLSGNVSLIGFGVCCMFTISECGSSTSHNCTYIQVRFINDERFRKNGLFRMKIIRLRQVHWKPVNTLLTELLTTYVKLGWILTPWSQVNQHHCQVMNWDIMFHACSTVEYWYKNHRI